MPPNRRHTFRNIPHPNISSSNVVWSISQQVNTVITLSWLFLWPKIMAHGDISRCTFLQHSSEACWFIRWVSVACDCKPHKGVSIFLVSHFQPLHKSLSSTLWGTSLVMPTFQSRPHCQIEGNDCDSAHPHATETHSGALEQGLTLNVSFRNKPNTDGYCGIGIDVAGW